MLATSFPPYISRDSTAHDRFDRPERGPRPALGTRPSTTVSVAMPRISLTLLAHRAVLARLLAPQPVLRRTLGLEHPREAFAGPASARAHVRPGARQPLRRAQRLRRR